MTGRGSRGLHRGSDWRVDIDRVGAALPLYCAHHVVDRAVNNRERARLQDRIGSERGRGHAPLINQSRPQRRVLSRYAVWLAMS